MLQLASYRSMVICILPPPEAMQMSKSSVRRSAKKASKGRTYSKAEVSPTSLPSSRMWTRTLRTPSFLASAIMAFRWSMWECTFPSENSPRKCRVEPFFFTFSIRFVHVSEWNILPVSMELDTSFAPCAKTCPEPKALCPTSELPISSSEGSPTAVPWAFRVRRG